MENQQQQQNKNMKKYNTIEARKLIAKAIKAVKPSLDEAHPLCSVNLSSVATGSNGWNANLTYEVVDAFNSESTRYDILSSIEVNLTLNDIEDIVSGVLKTHPDRWQEILDQHPPKVATPEVATPEVATPEVVTTSEQESALKALLQTLTPAPAAPAIPLGMDELIDRVDELERNASPREIEVVKPQKAPVKMGLQHREFETLLTAVTCGLHAYLVGAAGSFKTSAAGAVAKALDLECSSISVCQQTTAVALLGYMDARGAYVPTEFRKRYEEGGVFILDEIDNGNANVISVLNSALANGSCAFADGMVKRHEDFRLVATANTHGLGANAQYVGRCQLDAATLDRFAFIAWDYDEAMEKEIASNADWCKRVIALRHSAQALKSRIVISPRATFSGEKLLAAGMAQDKVEDLTIWGGSSSEEKKKILAGVK